MANKNDLFDFDETIASNNDNVQGANIAENCAPSGINNAIRGLAAIVKRAIGTQGASIASAATTNIGAAGTAGYFHITGTTQITSFGTVAAGTLRLVVFDGSLTLTHNAASLVLPDAVNIKTAAGDVALFVSEGSGNWRCLSYQTSKPTFRAHKNGTNQTNAANNTTTTITFGTESWDVGGFFAANAWAPPAGKYRITGVVSISGVADQIGYTLSILKNGATDASVVIHASSALSHSIVVTAVVDANGSDVFTLALNSTEATNKTIAGAAESTYFCGEAI